MRYRTIQDPHPRPHPRNVGTKTDEHSILTRVLGQTHFRIQR